jgi:hypothetical protein
VTVTPSPRPVDKAELAPRSVSPPSPSSPPIPYVTPRSGERCVPLDWFVLRRDGSGVGYRPELPEDRDRFGVLWWRSVPMGSGAGGRVPLSKVDPFRQREAMLGLRCQVCAGESSRTSRAVVELDRVTVVDIHAELAAAGLGLSDRGAC